MADNTVVQYNMFAELFKVSPINRNGGGGEERLHFLFLLKCFILQGT